MIKKTFINPAKFAGLKALIIPLLLLLNSSCTVGSKCVLEQDKHIKGQRHKYEYNHSKCPKQGNYYRWLFIIKKK